MTTRRETQTISKKPETEEPEEELFTQRKRPEKGQFWLQVDRQTKGSYTTSEAAEAAGMAIKRAHPVVQVSVYDSVTTANKIIELP
jgi:formylglycine-generating enzyme required for sulfatase activity